MFVEADGGTIFLDEIGDLTPQLQAKLLRVLQERELRPLGAQRPEKVDVRVLSATNRDLAQRMREGAFREDLFYRLNVIEVILPPLRDRAEDVLPLAEHFLGEAAARSGKRIVGFTQAALKILLAYPWPDYVRELENVVERAVALAEGDQITPEDLPSQVSERRSAIAPRTSCRSRSTSSPSRRSGAASPWRASRSRRSRRCSPTRGRATCASSRTSSSARSRCATARSSASTTCRRR